ncbi:MAG: HAD hydrolase-like protein, partial [Leptonema sp. (in: bacteria)]
MGISQSDMNIFFDLDGTLVDARVRLFKLFKELVPQTQLSFEEYWKLKRDKVSHEMILRELLHFDDIELNLFQFKWMNLIETKEYLNYDVPFFGVEQLLKKLKHLNISLYIVTARQYVDGVNYQIEKFGWSMFFKKILVTEQQYSKADLIQPFISGCNQNWIIGDTGSDILVGKSLNMKP